MAPFIGAEKEEGMAVVDFVLDDGMPFACILAKTSFEPFAFHIHVASEAEPLTSNGAILVTFDDLIDGKRTEGCVDISMELFTNVLAMPVSVPGLLL